jgi:hydroxypyruvate isomerase
VESRKHKDERKNIPAGVVYGRAEIDETQEIYYPAVMKAIAETDFNGYVGQEFVPKGPEPLESLRNAVRICDV